MSCELWGIDVVAGEAVLKDGGRWLFVSVDRAWRPASFDSEEEVFRWAHSHRLISPHKTYPSVDAAVIDARKVCLLAWRSGVSATDVVLRLFWEAEQEARMARARRRRRPGGVEWDQRFPEILQAALEMDGLLQARGYSVDDSLRLVIEALDRYRTGNRWRGHRPYFLRELFQIVHELANEADNTVVHFSTQGEEDRQLQRHLGRLSKDALQCLSLLGDWEPRQIATLLAVPVERVQEHLKEAMKLLGCPLDELRRPEITWASERLASEILPPP